MTAMSFEYENSVNDQAASFLAFTSGLERYVQLHYAARLVLPFTQRAVFRLSREGF
jgi:hypothetical protein